MRGGAPTPPRIGSPPHVFRASRTSTTRVRAAQGPGQFLHFGALVSPELALLVRTRPRANASRRSLVSRNTNAVMCIERERYGRAPRGTRFAPYETSLP